ncbi:MAG: acetylglutamate kinase [Acidobacteria bacterium]|nr:acetylglutamate kinase [Acidobacteriota bacterium]
MSKSLSGVDVGPVVLKLGGELIDTSEGLDRIATLIAQAAAQRPVVVIHGGGREIDSELARAGLDKRVVDGLRITDQATLDVVVGVLAGRVNTRLVAAVTRAGAPAVGLTGADDRIGLCRRASPYRALDGNTADLGLVGQPLPTEAPRLLDRLRRAGYTPIVACIGVTQDGQLLNVNADMLAAQLAVNLKVGQLIILGATAGVLDSNGHSLTRLDDADVEQLVASGDITAGMVAKLDACRLASRSGVNSVIIADGRRANDLDLLPGTVITAGDGPTNPQASALTKKTNKKGAGRDE